MSISSLRDSGDPSSICSKEYSDEGVRRGGTISRTRSSAKSVDRTNGAWYHIHEAGNKYQERDEKR